MCVCVHVCVCRQKHKLEELYEEMKANYERVLVHVQVCSIILIQLEARFVSVFVCLE